MERGKMCFFLFSSVTREMVDLGLPFRLAHDVRMTSLAPSCVLGFL